MRENELKHIGNQLAEMTERELNEVLLQLCNRKNFSSDFPREFMLYLEKIMETESFDCFGNMDEESQAYWDELFPDWKLYRAIEKKLRAVTEIFPFNLEITSGPSFSLTSTLHPNLYFCISPLRETQLGPFGNIEFRTRMAKTSCHYNNEKSFLAHFKEWFETLESVSMLFHEDSSKTHSYTKQI